MSTGDISVLYYQYCIISTVYTTRSLKKNVVCLVVVINAKRESVRGNQFSHGWEFASIHQDLFKVLWLLVILSCKVVILIEKQSTPGKKHYRYLNYTDTILRQIAWCALILAKGYGICSAGRKFRTMIRLFFRLKCLRSAQKEIWLAIEQLFIVL